MANNLIMLKQQLVFVYIFMCGCVWTHICTHIYIRIYGHFKEFYIFVDVDYTI